MGWRSGVGVVGPDSREWVVRRRWVPRLGPETLWGRFRSRIRGARERTSEFGDLPDLGCAGGLAEGLVVGIVGLVTVLVVLLVLVPLLVALVDVLVLLVLALLGALARVMLRRAWIVEAAHAESPVRRALRWKVVGWRASGERCREIARALEAGIVPPDGEEVAPARTT